MKGIIITQLNQYSQFVLRESGGGLGRGGGSLRQARNEPWDPQCDAAQKKIYGKAVFIADWL